MEQAQKKNSNFIQLYREHITEIRWLTKNNPVALDIFLFILEHMDYKNSLACSYSVLEDYTGKSRSTLCRAIKILRENGFISIFKMGTCNVYTINPEIAWSSWDNQKQYAKFDGVMLISKKENKDYFQMQNKKNIKVISNPNKIENGDE